MSFQRLTQPSTTARFVRIAGAAAGAAVLASLWAMAIEPRLLDEQQLEVEVPYLPESWDGRRLALLADMQIGIRFGNTDTVRRAVRRAVACEPALVLLAGDFVYEAVRSPQSALRVLGSVLRPLAHAGIPSFAVLGNHDFGEEGSKDARIRLAQQVRATLETACIRVLENEAVTVGTSHTDEAPLFVVGIGPHIPHRDDPLQAISRVPEHCPRVVVMHNPSSFAGLPPDSAPFALAGHTHGGQLRIPFLPRLSLGRLTVSWPEYVDGWIDGLGQSGNHLYVNRGLGFSRRPMRFGCPPELTVVTLRSPAAKARVEKLGAHGALSERRLITERPTRRQSRFVRW